MSTDKKQLATVSSGPLDSTFRAVKALVNHYSIKGYVLSVEIKVGADGLASATIRDAE